MASYNLQEGGLSGRSKVRSRGMAGGSSCAHLLMHTEHVSGRMHEKLGKLEACGEWTGRLGRELKRKFSSYVCLDFLHFDSYDWLRYFYQRF